MKLKAFLLIGVLALSAVLSSCGKGTSAVPAANTPETVENAVIPPAEAAPEDASANPNVKEKALAAYLEILDSAPAIEGEHAELYDASFSYEQNESLFGRHYDLFAVYDINRDDIPELIAMTTVNCRWTPISVYTFADGEAVLLKDPMHPEAHGTFEQMSTAAGAYSTYICKEDHIHSVWRGNTPIGEVEENSAFILTSTTLMAVEHTPGEGEDAVSFYDIAKANTAENRAAILD